LIKHLENKSVLKMNRFEILKRISRQN